MLHKASDMTRWFVRYVTCCKNTLKTCCRTSRTHRWNLYIMNMLLIFDMLFDSLRYQTFIILHAVYRHLVEVLIIKDMSLYLFDKSLKSLRYWTFMMLRTTKCRWIHKVSTTCRKSYVIFVEIFVILKTSRNRYDIMHVVWICCHMYKKALRVALWKLATCTKCNFLEKCNLFNTLTLHKNMLRCCLIRLIHPGQWVLKF